MYVYDGNTHDCDAAVATKALLACKTCVMRERVCECPEEWEWNWKKFQPPPRSDIYVCAVGWIIRTFFVLRFPLLTPPALTTPSHTKLFFSLKNNKNEKILTPPSQLCKTGPYVCWGIYSTNTVVNFLTGFAKQGKVFAATAKKKNKKNLSSSLLERKKLPLGHFVQYISLSLSHSTKKKEYFSQ